MKTNNKVYRKYIEGKFGQIHLRISEPIKNELRPILCIHLSPLSGIVYEKFLSVKSLNRVVIAPDTPGYGMSDGPDSQPNIEDYSKTMLHLVNKLNLKEIDIIGYGTGSKIAFQMGLTKPEIIKHTILISAPDYNDTEVESMKLKLGNIIKPKDDGSHLIELWNQVKSFPTNDERMKIFPDHIKAGEKKPWGPRAAFSYSYKNKIDNFIPKLLVINIQNEITEPTRRLSKFLKKENYLERLDWQHGFLDIHGQEFANIVSKFTQNY